MWQFRATETFEFYFTDQLSEFIQVDERDFGNVISEEKLRDNFAQDSVNAVIKLGWES